MQIMYLALPYFLAVALSYSLTAEDGSEVLEEELFGGLHIGGFGRSELFGQRGDSLIDKSAGMDE